MSTVCLCSRCHKGLAKDESHGWGECPVCGQDLDIACLTELREVR